MITNPKHTTFQEYQLINLAGANSSRRTDAYMVTTVNFTMVKHLKKRKNNFSHLFIRLRAKAVV